MTIMFLHALILLHGRTEISNRWVLALLALLIPVAIHRLLERSEIANQYVLGKRSASIPTLTVSPIPE